MLKSTLKLTSEVIYSIFTSLLIHKRYINPIYITDYFLSQFIVKMSVDWLETIDQKHVNTIVVVIVCIFIGYDS